MNLFGRVGVRRLASHKVKEGIKEDVATVVGINNRHNALEVNITLLVLTKRVSQTDKA